MKLCEAPTKIVGVQVGEVAIDLIRIGAQALKVKMAVFSDDGPVGFMEMGDSGHWSQKSLDAMKMFTEALEEDALKVIFKIPTQDTETSSTDKVSEPVQF